MLDQPNRESSRCEHEDPSSTLGEDLSAAVHLPVALGQRAGLVGALLATLVLISPSGASASWRDGSTGRQQMSMDDLLLLFALLIVLAIAFRQLRSWMGSRREQMLVEERVRERTRIARTLHDTLLQGAQGFVFAAQAAQNRMGAEDPAREMLELALRRADEVVAEARDRIQNLRGWDHGGADLPTLLSAVGIDRSAESAVKFAFEVEGSPRELRPLAADEAFLIGREALSNAFRHGGATVVELAIRYTSKRFVVSVRDDGRGIHPEVLARSQSPGHWGLRGMQESAERIQAQLQIQSRPGHGTEIELRIDSNVAYGSRTRQPWFPVSRSRSFARESSPLKRTLPQSVPAATLTPMSAVVPDLMEMPQT